MALIVPNELPSGASKGEKFLHQLLSEKLTDDFYVWYEYNIAGELPSFTILSPKFGLLIIQINSCYPNQISNRNNNNNKFTERSLQEPKLIESQQLFIENSGRRTRKRSRISSETKINQITERDKIQKAPFKSGIDYIDKLQTYQILTYPDGKLVFPVGVSVVMSNITESQGRERNIYNSLNDSQIIYREEFLLWDNLSGEDFVKRLERIFPVIFAFTTLTNDQIEISVYLQDWKPML